MGIDPQGQTARESIIELLKTFANPKTRATIMSVPIVPPLAALSASRWMAPTLMAGMTAATHPVTTLNMVSPRGRNLS